MSTYTSTEPLNLAAVRELAAAGARRHEAAWVLVMALADELERSRADRDTPPAPPDPQPAETDFVTLARDWFVALFHGVDCGCESGLHSDSRWADYRALADAIMWQVEVGRPVADLDAGRHAAVQVWLPLRLPDLSTPTPTPAERDPDASPRIRDAAPTDQEARP